MSVLCLSLRKLKMRSWRMSKRVHTLRKEDSMHLQPLNHHNHPRHPHNKHSNRLHLPHRHSHKQPPKQLPHPHPHPHPRHKHKHLHRHKHKHRHHLNPSLKHSNPHKHHQTNLSSHKANRYRTTRWTCSMAHSQSIPTTKSTTRSIISWTSRQGPTLHKKILTPVKRRTMVPINRRRTDSDEHRCETAYWVFFWLIFFIWMEPLDWSKRKVKLYVWRMILANCLVTVLWHCKITSGELLTNWLLCAAY